MSSLPRQSIFGIPYVVSELADAGRHLAELAATTAEPQLVAHSDVHVLTRMLHERDYGEGLSRFHYICPDGMPIVWLMRRKGAAAHRLYGPDMMETVCDCGRAHGLRHFLLGGSERAIELLSAKFNARFPGLQIVGHYCPPMGEWSADEHTTMCRHIAESGANCVWVALGCPKQEHWLYSQLERLPAAVYFGVGAAFNFHAGLVSQAPRWVRSHGLEWLYRLCCEPRRLFRRYLVHNSRFLWYCLSRKI